MNNPDISLKHALTAVRKTTLIMAIFAAVFILAAFRAHASDTVLTVQKDGVTVKEFSQKELQDIATEEGNKTYSYSAWSNEPEFRMYTGISGPTVKGVLTEADNIFAEITDKCVVSFSADRTVSLTGKQLLNETRYYYPNGGAVDHAAGIIPEYSKNGAVETPAVINLEDGNGMLCVGQTGPSEENDELFLEGLVDPEEPGVINVSTSDAPVCNGVKLLDLKAGSIVFGGTEVTLVTPEPDERICFSMDKSISAGFESPVYNYGPDLFCKPVLNGDDVVVTIKFKVKGYGKQDHSLQTISFSVGDALRVSIDGEIKKSYHLPEEVESIAAAERYSYSAYNTNPTHKTRENVEGIPVESIIKDATGKDVSEFNGNGTIRFTGNDGYTTLFTLNQLFGSERYYFPNEALDCKGEASTADEYEGRQAVPAIIELSGNNTLCIGQTAPNEQNYSEYVDYMLNLGHIDIITSNAKKCDAPAPVISSGSVISPGTAIKFPFPSKENRRDKLYYIVDPAPGEVPGPGDAFYYYGAFHWPEEMINPPVLKSNGKHTISIVLTSYGKIDSTVKTLTYYVSPAVGKPTIKLKAGKKKITVRWSKAANADGYVIYRSTRKKSGYKLIKTIKSGNTVSFVNKKLAKGKKYYYKVRAYRTVGDKNIYGSYSAVKYKKAK